MHTVFEKLRNLGAQRTQKKNLLKDANWNVVSKRWMAPEEGRQKSFLLEVLN